MTYLAAYLAIGLVIYIVCWVANPVRMRGADERTKFWVLFDCLTIWPVAVFVAARKALLEERR